MIYYLGTEFYKFFIRGNCQVKLTPKILLRVCTFGVITLVVLLGLNSFFQPVWSKWNNYYTTKGFYEEPENTIETLFLGASVMQTSVSPMQMYEEYGINSYNLGTEQQPMLGSYYWLRETYDYHGETLKNVVIDVSALRSTSKKSFYHKCFDNMKLSKNKLQGVYEYCNESITDTVSFIVPLISYHNRWETLEVSDFTKYDWEADTGTRGYYYIKNIYIKSAGYDGIKIRDLTLNENEEPEPLLADSLEYFDRIVKFCEEKELNLILIKTATNLWSSALHNAVQELADGYGLEFYDFNFEPLHSTNGFVYPFDSSSDGEHLNYFGAQKITKWMGELLVEKYGATDIRDNPKYDFLKEQYKEYEARVLQHVNLISSKKLIEYLDFAFKGDNTVFIAAKENAYGKFTDADKAFFLEHGLEKLAELTANDSYIAVIENGKVIYEESGINVGSEEPISYKGVLPDGKTTYRVESGGKNTGNIAEIVIDKKPQIASGGRGLNLLVYSNELGEILDKPKFDTTASTSRDCYGINDSYIILDEKELNKDYTPNTMRDMLKRFSVKLEELRAK